MTSHMSEKSSDLGKLAEQEKSEDENKKEKNLTVRPFRLQLEDPKHTLKQTLNIVIKASDVIPLETQIAGHGSCNDGQRLARFDQFAIFSKVYFPKGHAYARVWVCAEASSSSTKGFEGSDFLPDYLDLHHRDR